ncbi:MAG: N-acetylglucosamine-6-phosphate deacetylase, partial [Clostridia bacterium]|nr:N-acetylglucosamine-6-phosphate deacetylase [Clostridia bacterium]
MKAIINARVVFPDRVVDGGGILFGEEGILASGRIEAPEGVETVDAHGLYVGPGLVDEHLHGYQQYGE